jgi:hypothetical protein
VTHNPIRTEPDGTRVYSQGHRYKPLTASERRYAVRRPDHPGAVRWYGEWLLPLPLVADSTRVMPETRPDTDAYEHWWTNVLCKCDVCRRPQAEAYRRRAVNDHKHRRRAKQLQGPTRGSS